MTTEPESPYLTTSEAATYIRSSTDYVARQCAAGAIQAKRLGRSWRIHRDELDRFMADGHKAPATRVRRRRAS